MRSRTLNARLVAGAVACLLGFPLFVAAQPDAAADPAPAAVPAGAAAAGEQPAVDPDAPVNESQEVLAARYKRFERLLLQVSEYLRKSDPDKADLLVRAVRLSKETQISGQFDSIVNLLRNDQLGDAVQRQDELVTHLQALLYLLQSESILERNQREQERIKDLLKDLGVLIGKQRDVRAGTERRGDADRLAGRQDNVKGDARKLADKIDGQDAQRARDGQPGTGQPQDGEPKDGEPEDGQPSDGKPSDGKPSDGKPSEGKPSDGKPSEGKPQDGKPEDSKPEDSKPEDSKPEDSKPEDSDPKDGQPSDGQPSDGKPSDGKPSQGQPQQGQPPQDQQQQPGQSGDPSQQPQRTPGREEIERAIQEMDRAIEELKKQHHSDAARAQDEALRNLIAAKEKLEEILRQLREEERELLLAALEARFQKMLAMQIMVYKGTVSLDKTEKPQWQSEQFSRSRELAQRENEIALEAGKALTLLKAEGSSVAFPEAVEQLRVDMLDVARRLDEFDTGRYTQDIERDIIEALEEVIEALQRELEKSREQREQPPQEGQPSDPALVDMLAELKMLRSLQLRINRRTRSIARLIRTPEGQATEGQLVQDLKMLSRRQAAVQQATYDLATGRNK
ncbi:MAG TPA: hypothetical protein VML55_08315 [Planctomycetaceae bacterium]|nr:hypothetical protein [Planctomycetaceae bacterium]